MDSLGAAEALAAAAAAAAAAAPLGLTPHRALAVGDRGRAGRGTSRRHRELRRRGDAAAAGPASRRRHPRRQPRRLAEPAAHALVAAAEPQADSRAQDPGASRVAPLGSGSASSSVSSSPAAAAARRLSRRRNRRRRRRLAAMTAVSMHASSARARKSALGNDPPFKPTPFLPPDPEKLAAPVLMLWGRVPHLEVGLGGVVGALRAAARGHRTGWR